MNTQFINEIRLLRAEEELQDALIRVQPHVITDEEARIPTMEEVARLVEKTENARSALQERTI